jgi:hypothetical protein
MRGIVGIILGIVLGLGAMMAIAYVGGNFFPAPPPAPGDLIEQAEAALPASALGFKLVIVLSWFLGTLIGAWIAKAVSGSSRITWAVVVILTLLLFGNVFVVAFPGWMEIASVAAPLLGGLIGNHLARERVALPPEAAATTEA